MMHWQTCFVWPMLMKKYISCYHVICGRVHAKCPASLENLEHLATGPLFPRTTVSQSGAATHALIQGVCILAHQGFHLVEIFFSALHSLSLQALEGISVREPCSNS